MKVFRFHEGSNLYGWDRSNPLNERAIAAIQDPNGEHASREITSIPSPFARIDLVNTAFKEVANASSLEGETIYHKMVSDALDIGEILFNFDKYKDKIEIISWNPSVDLENLLNSNNNGHRTLGESLRLFLKQDEATYNFDKMNKLYLLNYKLGSNPINIIGGTSPASLFFTSANTFKLEGFVSGNDIFFDDDYCSLHKREDSFIEYIFKLSKVIPNFATDFANVENYLSKVFPLLDHKLRDNINNLSNEAYDSLPNLNIDGSGEIVEILNTNLKRRKGNAGKIKESDFVLQSEKNLEEEKPVLVLPNSTISEGYKYITADWITTNKAPNFVEAKLENRVLPFDGSKYPYHLISDFLEPVLIRTEHPIDEYYFENGKSNSKHGYLFPLKPLFFEYFSAGFLDKSINGEKVFEIKTIANNNVDVFLRLPIQNNKSITYKRTYYNPINQAHRPEFDESDNKGAIIENRINMGITPFYRFPKGTNVEYNVAFYDADFIPLLESNNYGFHFYNDNNSLITSIQKVQRRFKGEENVNMLSLVVNSNFKYVQVENDFAKGVLIPKFDDRLSGGLEQFTFAIDFGTTNTHVEYSKEGQIAKPLEFSNAESNHIGHLIDDAKHDEAFLKLCKVDLVPNNIVNGGNFSFPQRTVSAYHKQVNFSQPVFSMGNISIPFKYEKGSFAVNTQIKTNLKWNQDDSSGPVMHSFFEQLIKMIRNKVLLNNGDLKKTKIVWSYPASMMIHRLNKLEDQWSDIITKYLGEDIDVVKACESLTPFYYLYEEKGVPALAKPVVSIDIGGGTSDIAVFKETKPILFSSYKFAGDAIFGDNYNRNININGFVKKYNKTLSDRLNENNFGDLIGVLNNIVSRNNSNDAVNALFSIENNKQLKDKRLNVSFLNELKDDTELKIIFLIFYVAQVYHVAQILKAKNIEIPSAFSFSGTASKLLTIIDGSSKENLKAIAKEVFQYVFETQEEFKIDILLEDNPKEIAAKGAIYYGKYDEVNLKTIKEVLITSDNLSSNKELTYEDIDALEEKAFADYNEFLKFFFDLNKTLPFRDYFGIERETLRYTIEFLNEKSLNALKMGIQNKKQELDHHTDEPIVETLFFYPLVGSLGELAYNLVSK